VGKLFYRAKEVIDEMVPIAEGRIEGTTIEKMVKKRLSALTGGYGWGLLSIGRKPIDYTKLTTHIAYMYRSFSAHADWVCQALDHASIIVASRFKKRKIRIACIGGGPGSDIAGVLKFAEEHQLLDAKFEFTVLDREEAWDEVRDALINTYEGEANTTTTYQLLDLAAGEPWTDDWSFVESDLFIFSFVLSEVWSFNKSGSVSGFIERLVSKAPKGALICYVDNGGSNFTPLVEKEFDGRKDLKLIGSRDSDRLFMDFDEQCAVIEDAYRGRFGERPKLTGNVALRVWQKI
jgi:hypothetical protein